MTAPFRMLLQNSSRHLASYIGETEITTGIMIGELLVIDPEQVQDGGMEVMHMHGILLRAHPNLV